MKSRLSLPGLFCCLLVLLAAAAELGAQSLNLIPAPAYFRQEANQSLPLSGLEFTGQMPPLAGKALRYFENSASSGRFRKRSKSPQSGLILNQKDGLAEGAYELNCNPKGISISAGTESGFLHAFQTLVQLLELNTSDKLPCFEIKDAPAFSWRGLHLDVSRHFFPVAEIKKMLRTMSFYKLNVFHWHLTDDQGWRIEIKRYPELCKTGSRRKETLIGHAGASPEIMDGKECSGFYTQEEIRSVVEFAQNLGITVVPEIEMPGHSQAAVSAYPWLGNTGKNPGVWTKWGVSPFILAPKDSVFTFLENVLTEVIELFPSRYIHIGGDEATKEQWIESPAVQKQIKELGLKDEHELQSWFIRRIEKFVNSKGRQIIGWDEILEGGLAPNAAVMSWRGESGGIEAARLRHPVVMSPGKPLYFDHYQSENFSEPLAIGGLNTLENVYAYHPLPEGLKDDEKKYILGAQANLWTEYITSDAQLEYMAFPRAMALAEACWTPKEKKNLPDFLSRLENHRSLWRKMGLNFRNWK